MPPPAEAVVERITRRLFGSPIVRNSIRGEIVEEIVAMALEPDWELCAGDWAAFDLRHRLTGARMQVKQSAARQSWYGDVVRSAKPRFSIAEKTGRWEGDAWIGEPGRNADVFVFAWHAVTDQGADHRDPEQWLFYVIATDALPQRKSISLAAVATLSEPTSFDGLRSAVSSYVGDAGEVGRRI